MQATPPPTLTPYPIGTPGQAWGAPERAAWLARQRVQRSYADEVLAPLQAHPPAPAECFEYGQLDYRHLGLGTYPLMAVRSRDWQAGRPTVLVTGGVHGYETSGVQGALLWLRRDFARWSHEVNVLVLPAISPWGYETINRWNPEALDPNRLFKPDSPSAEAHLAMACVAAHAPQVDVHVDLHETTDSDNDEFGPAKAARDGTPYEWHEVPDGFYVVGDTARPVPAFQQALIEAVARVTPIAEPDPQGCIIGSPVQAHGVIHYDFSALGLCGGITQARFTTTTEVYPDSPRTTPAACNEAQATTINRAIEFLLGR
ncbi:M14 family metallopeptidase [Inhella gelatinilytica]|uniref:M14 family metallocarboxypeptidase n=1 Tax=Inhella gelatinilytica TaxID=2795030 RepID=A0A931IRN1_9BURK|nr:M14 family metallocarboxypeptidase [Inhella gelatinilytica]MBH9551422.1 M14 family metallocarboxypeptidase [Inhella gelatinilytica]